MIDELKFLSLLGCTIIKSDYNGFNILDKDKNIIGVIIEKGNNKYYININSNTIKYRDYGSYNKIKNYYKFAFNSNNIILNFGKYPKLCINNSNIYIRVELKDKIFMMDYKDKQLEQIINLDFNDNIEYRYFKIINNRSNTTVIKENKKKVILRKISWLNDNVISDVEEELDDNVVNSIIGFKEGINLIKNISNICNSIIPFNQEVILLLFSEYRYSNKEKEIFSKIKSK